jgi:predicted NAD-dependent protein-ADP-ribosyltransferase YbiA (DUF1768 family)
VGLISRHLPFTTSNTTLKTFRHAPALDERRARFKLSHWNRHTAEEIALSNIDMRKRALGRKRHAERQDAEHAHTQSPQDRKNGKFMKNADLRKLELQWPSEWTKETDVEEVKIGIRSG